MPLTNILSGAAFKTALWSLLIFLLALSLAGFIVYRLVETTMYEELAERMVEDLVPFQKVDKEGGKQALVSAIDNLEAPVAGDTRVLALFDLDGQFLAGNKLLTPDFIGWATVTLSALLPDKSGEYYSHLVPLSGSTLVIGRNTQLIKSVLHRLQRYMLIAGLAVMVSTMVLGYALSQRVDSKLRLMTQALDAVSRGDMSARLDVSPNNDQIDRASRQINQHLEQLSSLMASTRNTIQAIAHDVRTPLNRAFLLLQESQLNPKLDDFHQQNLEEAARELANVTEIFDTMLRISKIAANQDSQNFTVFPLGQFLQEIIELFEPIAESSGHVLSGIIANDAVTTNLRGDQRMLRQMMVNLVENAICHCPSGTHIKLVALKTSIGNPRIQVLDDGPGIPLENLLDVLKPFYRLDASRSTPGNGLGLSLVNAIAGRHQAQLALEDNQPGLRVSLTFPPAT